MLTKTDAQLLVEKELSTGEVRVTGTARDIDYYVREYEAEIGENSYR